jgi:hypothetical protein
MTQKNGGLDPSTGIQIHPLLSGVPEKLKDLQLKEDILFAKLKEEIEQVEKSKAQNLAMLRAHMLVNHVAAMHNTHAAVPVQAMARILNILGHLE